jgi:hypothetical protein
MPRAERTARREEKLGLGVRHILHFEHEALTREAESVEIVPLPCMHYGNPAHVSTLLEWAVSYIQASPTRFGLFMGDMMENAITGSKGDVYECAEDPQDQIDYITGRFRHISGQIIGVIRGNHENRARRAVGIDPGKVIADILDIPYLGIEGIIKISFGQDAWTGNTLTYLIYAHHGVGGGRTMGAKANALSRMTHRVEGCDVYMMAHTHQMMAYPEGVYMPIGPMYKKVKLVSRLMVMCGSFMEGAEYAAEKMYQPVVPGTVVVSLSGKTKAMTAQIKAGGALLTSLCV